MARNRKMIVERNKKIVAYYEKERAKRIKLPSAIMADLAKTYYLSYSTIQDIIYRPETWEEK